jgi:hypothetical protein
MKKLKGKKQNIRKKTSNEAMQTKNGEENAKNY